MSSFFATLALLATLALVVSSQNGKCDFCGPFEVTSTSLPSYVGPSPFPFKSYTGYVVANTTGERNLFYWLVESQSSTPEQDPLVFWYQGGPGCSGLGGLFTEHGPFHVNYDGNVELTQYTWNTNANVVYLEQPCGVGFSFDQSGVYESNDQQSASDNFQFVEGFLKANPKFVGRKTWLAGESYGGVYIPTLTGQILDNPNSNIYKQLYGTMLGNPVMSCDSLKEKDVLMNIFFWHQLISHSTYTKWNNAGCPDTPGSALCTKQFIAAYKSIGKVYQEIGSFTFNGTQPSLDPDDLYQDFILGNGTLEWTLSLQSSSSQTLDQLAVDYLNRQDVQKAIFAQAPPAGSWDICTPQDILTYNTSGESMIPFYQRLISKRPDVSILVYSGDIDMATVPAAQTQLCLAELMGTPISGKSWAPWYVNAATAGYVEYFQEYTYATVKGAGHTVPTYQPLTGYNLFERFSQNQNLDGGEIYFDSAAKGGKTKPLRQSDMLRKYGVVGF